MRQNTLVRCLVLVSSLFLFVAVRGDATAVRLNEILADNTVYTNADGTITDVLELYNTSASAEVLTGCSLSDSNTFPQRYIFPSGAVIPGHGFYRMTCDSSRPASTTNVNFGIKATGGFLYFYSSGLILIDSVEYGLQIKDHSIGRAADGTGPWVLTVPTLGGPNNPFTNFGTYASLKINEWLVKQSSTGPNDFFEIFNLTNKPVAIGGTFVSDNVAQPMKARIPELSFIGTGWISGYLKFTADSSAAKYPADHVNFGFGDSDSIGFYETNTFFPSPNQIDFIAATPAAYGVHTNDVSRGRLPDGSTNLVYFTKVNDYDTFSPGEPNFKILPYFNNGIINELLAHTDPPLEDAVEIQNRSSFSLDISGWWLSNQRSNRKKYLIPNGPAIPVGGFRVIYEGVGSPSGFNGYGTNAVQPFTFNSAHGDQAVLSQVDANGNLTGYVIYEEFESSANGVSFGHYDTTQTNDYKFVAMSARSFGVDEPLSVEEFRTGTGLTNPFPRVGPIVINEIMYAPSNTVFNNTNGVPTTNQNPAEEYIEVRNISNTNVVMFDPLFPTNRYRIQTALNFSFPLTNMPPNSFAVIVGFDPYTDLVALANFRSRFNVASNVPIFGPWTGRLADSGDAVELYRPDPPQSIIRPDYGYVPWIRTDKVNYKDSAPWPSGLSGANGTGRSLQRRNSSLFGNDAVNWAADVPNPGVVSLALQDNDLDGIPDQWEQDHGLSPTNAGDAMLDFDNDGVTNLGEYQAGTNPNDPSSFLKIERIVPFAGTNTPVFVRFLAYSNTTYSVQYRNSLLPSSEWQKLGDINVAPTNRMVEVPDANAYKKTDRYYRVVAPATN